MKKRPLVSMVIEGAYPYIVGGVAAWCHLLISEIKEVDFSLVLILPAEYRKRTPKYEYPKNVVDVHEIYLDTEYDIYDTIIPKNKKEIFQIIEKFHDFMKLNSYSLFNNIINKRFSSKILTDSEEAIATLFDMYTKYKRKENFMKYFWTWKSTHLPLFRIMNYSYPHSDMYHAVSTGYAGFAASIAKIRLNIPFLLTEHGIYAMEREEEIERSELIDKDQKKFWINFYHSLCRISYSFADKIITLYRGNMLTEIANNAQVDKIQIIPNGVDFNLYAKIGAERETHEKVNVGLVARVVPIKDVKTFIKAANEVLKHTDKAMFYIVGPTDENEEYYQECKELVKELGIEDKIIFTGRVNMKEYYKKLDVVVLTSIREAQPLVLLEAMAVGLPCIATDVGSCRELLEGVGFIMPPKDYKGIADAMLRLIENDDLRLNLGKKGQERVKKYYEINDVIDSYRNLYFNMSSSNHEELMAVGWDRI